MCFWGAIIWVLSMVDVARVDARLLFNEDASREWIKTVIQCGNFRRSEQHLCTGDTKGDPSKPACMTMPVRFGSGERDGTQTLCRSFRCTAELGSAVDVYFVVIGLWMASEDLLAGAIAATPTLVAGEYFGSGGERFRDRVGDGLLGHGETSRVPAAVIVATEWQALERACAAHGVPPVIH